MELEIEAKLRVADPATIRTRLRQARAKLVSREMETNALFDTPTRRLRTKGEGLRLRSALDLDTGAVRNTLTHKGAVMSGRLKKRAESEVVVDSAPVIRHILEQIGYHPGFAYQKRRETYHCAAAGVEVVLDELPLLGWFVEVEGPDDTSIMKMVKALGLRAEHIVREGYPQLLKMELRRRHLDVREVNFGTTLMLA